LGGPDAGFTERFEGYAIKAAREGKVETSWTNPNEAYEKGLTTFVRRMLDRGESSRFIEAFDAFAQRTALLGALNGLAQLVLKATMPGVPDFYQGTEFWDFSLVDPDNRRPVDFAARAAALAHTHAGPDWAALVRDWPNGEVKLALTHRLLALRNELPAVFRDGTYEPIEVQGRDRDNVLAFSRSLGRDAVIVAVGRQWGRFTDSGRHWPEATALTAELQLGDLQTPRDVLRPDRSLSPGTIPIGTLFGPLPVAVLRAQPARAARAKPR
jgi:(1->4)-alpha-D-glucan 1-alpha-D-glucosylmutase